MERILTEEEFLEWRSHPNTVAVLRYLAVCREGLRQQWEAGAFTDANPQVTQQANLEALAKSRVYRELIELDYEQYVGVMHDE
jgi:hypothetical protein